MKALVRHFWERNREHVLRSSFLDCHVKGLHSVMLLDEPGKRIRLFVAGYGHELWRNGPTSERMSLGYHSHHCDVTLVGVSGRLCNRRAGFDKGISDWEAWLPLNRYRYSSKLFGNAGGFTLSGKDTFTRVAMDVIDPGVSVAMRADEIHTVFVDQGDRASWLVFEGKEDPGYTAETWSNDDLTTWTAEGLYRPMTEAEVETTLGQAGVL